MAQRHDLNAGKGEMKTTVKRGPDADGPTGRARPRLSRGQLERSGVNVSGVRHRHPCFQHTGLANLPDVRFELYDANVTDCTASHVIRDRVLPCWVTFQIEGGSAWVEQEGKRAFEIKSGQAGMHPAGTRHSIRVRSPKGYVSRWSHFAFRIMEGFDLLGLLNTPRVFDGAPARRIGRVNQRLSALSDTRGDPLRLTARINALGFELLDILMGCSEIRPEARDMLTGGRLHALLKCIHEGSTPIWTATSSPVSRGCRLLGSTPFSKTPSGSHPWPTCEASAWTRPSGCSYTRI